MNIEKEIENKTTIKLTVSLLEEEMKPYLDKATQRISKDVKIDGFRPGKAPYDVLKKKVGEMEIYQEAANDAIQDSLPKAAKREELEFIGQPEVSVEKLAPGNGLTYSATFALVPEVDLKDYKSINVKREEVKVDEEKMKRTLQDLRKMQSTPKPVDRAAKMGDQVVASFRVSLAGVPVEGGQGTDVPVSIGENQFIPGFEDNVVGMKKTEKKQFKLTFPKEYNTKHLAGKECDFDVEVKEVNEVILPELNDEFATKLNFKSLKELEEQVRGNIQREIEQEAEQKYENAVVEAVITQAEFDPIPQIMVKGEMDRMFEELQQDIQGQGGKIDDYLEHIKKTKEELLESWKEQAEKRVKGALVLKAVGEKDEIKVAEADIDAEIAKYSEAYKDAPEQKAQIDSFEFRSYARTMLKNQQVVQRMKDYASGKSKSKLDSKEEKKAESKEETE
ncbi:MAG: trigger factor [bacterium]|nr:trigger factor [bacterium]